MFHWCRECVYAAETGASEMQNVKVLLLHTQWRKEAWQEPTIRVPENGVILCTGQLLVNIFILDNTFTL